jgi:hypothetical protein
LQSVHDFKIVKWVEIFVLGAPDSKNMIFIPWSVRIYVRFDRGNCNNKRSYYNEFEKTVWDKGIISSI